MVGLPGAAQDRLPAHVPGARLAVLVFRGDLAKDAELLVLRHENGLYRAGAGPTPIAEDEKVAAFRGLLANRYRRDLAGRPVAGRGLAAARWLPPRRSS